MLLDERLRRKLVTYLRAFDEMDEPLLTQNQLEALRQYAAEHGRTWKAALNHDWMTGQTVGELQQVRNTFGPTWLAHFKF